MKKFILHILLYFGIVALLDFGVGYVFHYLQAKIAEGRTGAEYYVCKEMKDDIVIMGSSRASHHYVPTIITDSLGLSCFNAGQDGNGIILQYGRWKMISERYTPKVIIYDVNPGFDIGLNDNMAYLDRLKPFCNDKYVEEYIYTLFHIERLKLFSHMYRYNYKFIEIVSDCVKKDVVNLRGYIPLKGEIRKEMIDAPRPIKSPAIDEDSVKIYYLEQFAKECQEKGTNLIFIASPAFRGGLYNEDTFEAVVNIANKYNFSFLYYYDSKYSEEPCLFKDSYHLNDNGAVLFTNEIINYIGK